MEDRLDKKIEAQVDKQLRKNKQALAIEQRIKLPEEVAKANLELVKEENEKLLNIIELWCKRLSPEHKPVPKHGDRSALLQQLEAEESRLRGLLDAKLEQRKAAASSGAGLMQQIEQQASVEQQANERFVSFVDASLASYQLQNHLGSLQSELQRLESYSVLEKVYRFEFREDFAIINGVDMGTDDKRLKSFNLDDTSFGFGHLLSMIANILRKFRKEPPLHFLISPAYNLSSIQYRNTWYKLYRYNENDVAASDRRWSTAKPLSFSSSSSKKSRNSSRSSASRRCEANTRPSAPRCSHSASLPRTKSPKISGSSTS